MPDKKMLGDWPANDPRRAFVAGASWRAWDMEGWTLFGSERDKAEEEAERRYPDQSAATCSIALPAITEDMVDQFYPWMIAGSVDGYEWNQAAVDFACALKGECHRRRLVEENNREGI